MRPGMLLGLVWLAVKVVGLPFASVALMLLPGAHLLWQVHTLKIEDPALCLKLFRANRDTGALIAAALLLSSWIW